MPQRGDELLASRRAKLDRLIQRGVDPFPARFNRTHSTAEAIAAFSGAQSATTVKAVVAGRVARIRRMGKASFVDIEDSDGRLQLFVRSDVLGESYGLIDDIDLGDFVGASGDLMRTKAGEISLHDGAIIHGSLPNRSDRRRCGLTLRFIPAHVRQVSENSLRKEWRLILMRGEVKYISGVEKAPF